MASESSPLLSSASKRGRTSTADQKVFTRPFPSAVTYDLTTPDQATIKLPPNSTWTSGPHWHDTHTEFLQVLSGRADILLGLPKRNKTKVRNVDDDDDDSSSLGRVNVADAGNDDSTPKSDTEDGENSDSNDYHHLPAVGPLDGVIIVPKGTVHEWRRSTVEGLDEELVVKEWTDPKDGQKETFFRNLNGIILDALREQGEFDAEAERQGRKAKMSWRMRTLDLELNNLFWRMDNWPLVLEGEWWPGWIHGLATRCVLLSSVVLGSVLGCKGVYEEYEA